MVEKTKQWWESGYENGQSFLNQPRSEFADKKPGSGTGDGFGLWRPDTFWLKVAEPPATRCTKQIIFLDDGPIYVRQHSGQVPRAFMPSGVAWEKFTCGATGGYYDPQIYAELMGFKGVDQIPGNFAPCCGLHFRGTSKKGNPIPSNPFDMAYYSVLDCSTYTDKKGVTHQFVLKLFPAQGDTIDKLLRYREEYGTLAGCMYTAIRYRNKKSANVGEDFKFESKGDLSKVFGLAMYSGRKIADLYEEARHNPKFREALGKIIALPTAPDSSEILNQLAPFNYQEVLRPLPLEELAQLFGRVAPPASSAAAPALPAKSGFNIPGFSVGTPSDSDSDDDIPF